MQDTKVGAGFSFKHECKEINSEEHNISNDENKICVEDSGSDFLAAVDFHTTI